LATLTRDRKWLSAHGSASFPLFGAKGGKGVHVFLTVLTFIIVITPIAAEPQNAENAYTLGDGEICFDLPEGLVDWLDLARSSLGHETLRNPSVELLRRHYFEPGGGSVLPYEATVPPRISERQWLLLHETGSVVLRPTTLRGELFYRVDRDFKVLGGPTAFGKACGRIDDPDLRAAFVLSGISASEWSLETVSPVTEGDRRFSIKSLGQRYTFESPAFAVPRLKRVLLFRAVGETPLALAVWESDPHCEALCCEYAYSLYELGAGGALRVISENGYGCDV
jgi:hypothetical protein